jgi:hypothetical protein
VNDSYLDTSSAVAAIGGSHSVSFSGDGGGGHNISEELFGDGVRVGSGSGGSGCSGDVHTSDSRLPLNREGEDIEVSEEIEEAKPQSVSCLLNHFPSHLTSASSATTTNHYHRHLTHH